MPNPSHTRLAQILSQIEERCDTYERHPLAKAQKWADENDEICASPLIDLVVAGVRYCNLHGLRIPTGLELNELGATVNGMLRFPLTERIATVELFDAVAKLLEVARGHRIEIEAAPANPNPEPQVTEQPPVESKSEQLELRDDAKKPYIEWQGIRHHGLPSGTVEAFQKMYDAQGKAVGIGGGQPLRKPAEWYDSLPEELQEIVANDGNKGYYLTIFSATNGA